MRKGSYVHLQKGINRRSCMESSLHWTFLGLCQPKIRQIPCQMDEWIPQLRFCLSQVSLFTVTVECLS